MGDDMSRTLAYFITLISLVLFAMVIVGKYFGYFGIDIPIAGDLVDHNRFTTMIVAYVLLLLPSILR